MKPSWLFGDSDLSEFRLRFEFFLVSDTGSSSSFRLKDYLKDTKLHITDRDTSPIVCFNGKTSSKWIFVSRKCFPKVDKVVSLTALSSFPFKSSIETLPIFLTNLFIWKNFKSLLVVLSKLYVVCFSDLF